MSSYKDIIEEQRQKLNQNINWWPLYFYHFTDVHNAVNIIKGEYVYGRKEANEDNLMITENASKNVINVTDERVAKYARLYMRPKTPTQYHNEGHKPKHIRNTDLNANCPVPVFFFLDAEKTLSMDNIIFVEKGLSGHSYDNRELLSGLKAFSALNFNKIFHDGYHEPGSDITQYRHTEVIGEGGIPINRIIRGIVCRSIAEKQTLIYLLKNTAPNKYKKYRDIISYKPDTDLFYNNGIFIKTVKYKGNTFHIKLNDCTVRYKKENANGKDVEVDIAITWIADDKVVGRNSGHAIIDYKHTTEITYSPKPKIFTDAALVEIKFDGCLMYQNVLSLKKVEIV